MAHITTAADIKQLGTILAVWAHPDDESFTCAGILATAVQNGQTVVCLTATKGEKGNYDKTRWPNIDLALEREKELQSALKVLGIKEHDFLGYIDGELAAIPLDEGAGKVRPYIEKYQPNTILTFGSDGLTGHTDHIAVGQWAAAAAQSTGKAIAMYHATTTKKQYDAAMKAADEKFNMYFNIDQPTLMDETACAICYHLSPEMCQLKRQALAVMPTQTEAMLDYFDDASFAAGLGDEAFTRAS